MTEQEYDFQETFSKAKGEAPVYDRRVTAVRIVKGSAVVVPPNLEKDGPQLIDESKPVAELTVPTAGVAVNCLEACEYIVDFRDKTAKVL